jgi:glycosyltransferase involved in cell wall biosynthesis
MMAETLESAGLLERLVTRSVFTAGEMEWARRFKIPARWQRRPVAPVSRRRLRRVPLADLIHCFGGARLGSSIRATDASFLVVDRKAARLIGRNTSAVIAREDACLHAFERARALGIPTIYQLPTAYCETVRELSRREAEDFPEAFDQNEMQADFGLDRLARKREELAAAQRILCPSRFVQASVQKAGVPTDRIATIPLGIDTRWSVPTNLERQKLFLYVGNISARKGVHRLLRVWKKLGAHRTHTLRLIGDLNLPQKFLADYQGVFEHIPRVPRDALIPQYSSAQAFVFNTMADGFGHVFAEAMVCGTPVLASRNCGAPDLVTDGIEGRLFGYGDDEQLAGVLDWALGHPTALNEMGMHARKRAVRWGWGEFGAEFLRWVKPLFRTPILV